MPPFLSELFLQLKSVWARLDGGQRLTIVSVLFATVAGLGAVMWYAGQPDYQVVMSSEDPQVVREAQDALSKSGIPFTLGAAGLEVERSQVSAARSALLAEGVTGVADPESDVGLGGVTMDAASRRDKLTVQKRKRAQFAIEQLRGVASAYVTSEKPKRSPWAQLDRENQPAATIMLRIARGTTFRQVAPAAISAARSALGIPEEFIVAIDSESGARFQLEEHGGTALTTGDFLEQQRMRSGQLTAVAQELLDRAYPGKARVTVNVDLDPAWSRTSEKIVAGNALKSEESVKSTTTGAPAAGGDPTAAAAGGLNGPAGGSASNASGNKSETRNREYEPFAGQRESGLLAPDIRSMSIALVLDETIDPETDGGIAQPIQDSIRDLVLRAVNYRSELGTPADAVSMVVVPEFAVEEQQIPEGPGLMAMVREYGPMVGNVLAVGLVLLFLRGLLKKSAKPRATVRDDAVYDMADESVEEIEVPMEEQARRMRREIERNIAEEPAKISRILEGWLAEARS